jgi:hypothetical protein
MTKYIVYLLIATCSLTMVSCKSSAPQPERSKLTVGEVKRQITKGFTTQAEVVSLFGSPNLVSKNRDDKEVWAYNKMSFDSSRASSGASLILIGGSKATSSTTSKSMDLIITFDKNDVVEDYKVIYASY